MKRIASISLLILPLLALVSAQSSNAQTLVVDKPTLTLSGQVGGSVVSQTINVTSNTGAAIPFTLSFPSYPWLTANNSLYGYTGTTPAAVTISANPAGLAAGTNTANIVLNGGTASNNPIVVTFNVSTVGVSPQTLNFSYTLNSNNFPAPQNLALSSAAATQCTVTTNANGGNWIGPVQNPTVSPGNLTVQLNSSVVLGLAPNTYTGTITITPPSGPPAVVSVTLTVLPTPPVTVNPTSLILNYQTGVGAPNPSATFTIFTTVGQSVSYSISQSGQLINNSAFTPANGNTSATTGTALITYTVNPAGLAVGTYSGTLTLFTPGGSPIQTNIGVTLNVSATALLNVPNATVYFQQQVGTGNSSQSVNITATNGILNYSVSPSNYNPSGNTGWLSVPNAGSTATPLVVTINPAGLAAGYYSATVSVLPPQGSTAQQFGVVLDLTNSPTISTNVNALSFPFQIGQSTPATESVRITSSTGVPLNYTAVLATTSCGSGWLQAANSNNSLTGVTNDSLTVAVNTTGLTAGTCSGTITINASNPATAAAAVGSPIVVGVTLYVSTSAQLVLTPAILQPFTAAVGAQSPAAQSITLSSTNTDALSYSVAFQGNGGNWLFAGPQNGSTLANANFLTVSVVSSSLPAGVYTGTVTVTAAGPGGAVVADSPVIIPITLNVTSGSLTLSTTNLTFPDQTLGGAAPAAQTIAIGSSGQALNYTAVPNSNNAVSWLSVTPASGNTSTNGTLTVSVDGSKLAAGSYTGTIVVTAAGASNSPQTINVNFKVDPGTLSAPITTLNFTQAAGGPAPAAQSIPVSGSPVPLNFTAITTAISGGNNWLSVTPSSGTTPASVQVSVNGGSLAVGQYTGTVTIASAGAVGSPTTIGVILNVVTPATLTASPTSLSFAYTLGLPAPAAQNIAVSAAGGTGSVPLTAQAQFTSTGAGAWLLVTPASSTAPATFVVSISTAGLAAGTYNGSIVIASNNALASLTIPVTLTVTSIPVPVVSSVANAASYSTGAVSPGENIVIFGSGIGPATLAQATVTNNVFPTTVGNTSVLFDGVAAPVLYASNGQTSVMVPYGVAGRTTTSLVVQYSGVQSSPLTYNVAPAAPGIYTQNSQGSGPGAILNQNFSVNGTANPEKRGNVIAIYMTGEGQTTPQGVDGMVIPAVVSALKYPNLPVTVTVGGIPAVVAYAGSAPGLISGVMQVNVTIPLTAPTGTQPVVVTVGTANTQSGASAATVAIN